MEYKTAVYETLNGPLWYMWRPLYVYGMAKRILLAKKEGPKAAIK